MGELVNLRTERKRAARRRDDQSANANRLVNGQPKHLRRLKAAEQEQANRMLDHHRIEPGDGR